jgi:hypothetical protein
LIECIILIKQEVCEAWKRRQGRTKICSEVEVSERLGKVVNRLSEVIANKEVSERRREVIYGFIKAEPKCKVCERRWEVVYLPSNALPRVR